MKTTEYSSAPQHISCPSSLWTSCLRDDYLVSIPKWLIFPISASGSDVSPRNTGSMSVVNILTFLELGKISSFMNGHYLQPEQLLFLFTFLL